MKYQIFNLRGEVIIKNNFDFFRFLLILTCLSFLLSACNSTKENEEEVETIQTYLEIEFTGPSVELINALEQEGAYPPELQQYAEENYKSLVADLEQFVNRNWVMTYQRFAYENGYRLEPTNIEIQKTEDDSDAAAYNYEVKVSYNKDEKNNTANVTGRINLNENGEISIIRNVDDGGLLEKLKQ
ncbi:hypothetical protein [Rossellomorea aquimaris]|uniref:Uncharacterized protein n=1 Tax=Rossellomorea aquimaris TaxID=189382 RepID=A0A1J6VPQ7_9BACI|nr:hypothetical protein [Rossellomorea aquimaris]OIU66436.1 hypothetical protein BHE18_16510 [Rossellomorea aquimaris]